MCFLCTFGRLLWTITATNNILERGLSMTALEQQHLHYPIWTRSRSPTIDLRLHFHFISPYFHISVVPGTRDRADQRSFLRWRLVLETTHSRRAMGQCDRFRYTTSGCSRFRYAGISISHSQVQVLRAVMHQAGTRADARQRFHRRGTIKWCFRE